jgi:hypothetical protein
MDKKKVMKIRILQTAGKTVDEISEELNMNVCDVESKLLDLGYTPKYGDSAPTVPAIKKNEPENEPKSESEQACKTATSEAEESNEKRKYTRITDEQKKEICELYASGEHSYNTLAQKFNISKSSVVRIIKAGYTVAEYSEFVPDLPPDDDMQIPPETENEPAPAPTETSSKEKSLHYDNNISCAFCQGEIARKLRIVVGQLYTAAEFIPEHSDGCLLVHQSIGAIKLMISELSGEED